MNIPIYRAKKINSDEYVMGYLKITKYNNRTEYVINFTYDSATVFGESEIDPTTLAIHFPDKSSTQSEKVWYNMEEVSNIIKEYENGKMESN